MTFIRLSQERFAKTSAVTTVHSVAAEIEPFRIDSEITTSIQDMNDEELHSFAELQDPREDSASDEQIELHIYTCFLVFKRMGSTEHLKQGIQRTERWIAELAADHPDRTRRCRIIDMMSTWMSQLSSMLEYIELSFSGIR